MSNPQEGAPEGKPLPKRPANTTNAQDFKKSNDQNEQKDTDNG